MTFLDSSLTVTRAVGLQRINQRPTLPTCPQADFPFEIAALPNRAAEAT
jgi:hypothetical protein